MATDVQQTDLEQSVEEAPCPRNASACVGRQGAVVQAHQLAARGWASSLAIFVVAMLAIQAFTVRAVAAHGGSTVVYLLVDWGLGLLGIALIVRVVGSWIGASSYTPWMRPFVLATEWLLAPLRRVLPSFAMMDFSPLVAWFLIQVVRSALLAAL